jgi:hypothetical protein
MEHALIKTERPLFGLFRTTTTLCGIEDVLPERRANRVFPVDHSARRLARERNLRGQPSALVRHLELTQPRLFHALFGQILSIRLIFGADVADQILSLLKALHSAGGLVIKLGCGVCKLPLTYCSISDREGNPPILACHSCGHMAEWHQSNSVHCIDFCSTCQQFYCRHCVQLQRCENCRKTHCPSQMMNDHFCQSCFYAQPGTVSYQLRCVIPHTSSEQTTYDRVYQCTRCRNLSCEKHLAEGLCSCCQTAVSNGRRLLT